MFELYPLYSKNKPTADRILKEFDEPVKVSFCKRAGLTQSPIIIHTLSCHRIFLATTNTT